MGKLRNMVKALKRRFSMTSLNSRTSDFCEYEESTEDLTNDFEPGRCCHCHRIYRRNQEYAKLNCGHRYHVSCLAALQLRKKRKLERTRSDFQSNWYCCNVCATITYKDDVRVVIFLSETYHDPEKNQRIEDMKLLWLLTGNNVLYNRQNSL